MGAVDVWSQQTTDRFMQQPWLETLLRWTGKTGEQKVTDTAMTLAAMDKANIDISLLSAWHGPQGSLISNDEVAEMISEVPTRFRGLATVNLNDPMGSVRQLKQIVDRKSFVGVRVVPWLWDLPPNDRRYYPIYAACVELDVPFCTQIGHTGPLCRSEPGRPIPYLDDVLLDFPELVVVGGHVGFPWMDEVLSLARKYPNFYVDTSAYAVHRLPPQLTDFLRGAGRSRVLFGTNWPMISPAGCLAKLDELALDDEARNLFLEGNARRIFNLD
jgi:uncharacterized protein